MKIIFIFLLSVSFLFALDLNDFNDRQKILQDIKKVVQNEESIARAYEKYILENYAIPANINSLYTTNYLGTSVNFLSSISDFASNFNSFSLTQNKISYSLKDVLENDSEIKKLYESNTFRKRTYFRNDEIHFLLEDVFAKHLYDLMKSSNISVINDCPIVVFTTPVNCKEDNHIFIELTKKLDGGLVVPNTYLMSYHIDKFKTGPIIITDDTSKHITESAFDSISKGALLYDINGVKYLKTLDGIEVLK
jgi:hypothetical protein